MTSSTIALNAPDVLVLSEQDVVAIERRAVDAVFIASERLVCRETERLETVAIESKSGVAVHE